MNALLRIENVSITYKNQPPAVKNVSFVLKEGEICSIVGESGSGKTTLIRGILGLLSGGGKITEGQIFYRDKNITKLSRKEMNKVRGRDIAMIFQDAGLSMDPIRTVRSQFTEYIAAHKKMSRSDAIELASSWLLRMKLPDTDRILDSYPFELSGGMKQRVAIAMAMSQNPKVLLADEPTSALDVTIQAQVVYELKKLAKEYHTAIILVTHNMGVASYLSDQIGVMKEGEMVEYGTREQVIFHPASDYTRMLLDAVPKLD